MVLPWIEASVLSGRQLVQGTVCSRVLRKRDAASVQDAHIPMSPPLCGRSDSGCAI